MHIHESNANAYFYALTQSLARDARSFEHWFMLRGTFVPMNAEAWHQLRADLVHEMREKFAGVTVDVVFEEQPNLYLLSRDLDPKSLGNMAKIMGVESFVTYELSGQVAEVLALLASYRAAALESLPMPQYESADYPEIETLSEVFISAAINRGNRQPLHVLLVEDDALTVRMVSSLIRSNHAVFVAKDAEEALAQYMIHAPDIVFLDIGLPGVNGFEVLRHVRALDPNAYVVMFSGNRDLEHVCHALNLGARGFVGKPFRKENLHYYLSHCVAAPFSNPREFYAN